MKEIKNFEQLCELISDFENKTGLSGNNSFNSLIERRGEKSLKTKFELINCIYDFCLMSDDSTHEVSIDFVEDMFTCLDLVDKELGLGTLDIWSLGMSKEEIIDMWEEDEREEKRRESVELCAKIAYNEGLCDSEDEAWELAELYC